MTEIEAEVERVLAARREKGRAEYGVGLLPEQHNDVCGWLDEAIEEAADMLQYLVAMRVKMRKDADCV